MSREVLLSCLPWLGLLVVLFACLRLLVRMDGSRLQLGRLLHLHRDCDGGAQSFSFVLTLPIFLMVLMLIVQVSQIMIGSVLIHYAAFAAARSAIVWIPTYTSYEPANCVGLRVVDYSEDNVWPSDLGPTDGGMHYRLVYRNGMTYPYGQYSPKLNQIHTAARFALTPIGPSRYPRIPPPSSDMLDAFYLMYSELDPNAWRNSRIRERLSHKLGYVCGADDSGRQVTEVTIGIYHSNREVRLEPEYIRWRNKEWVTIEPYAENEIGWHDPVTVSVTHHMALLPGPWQFFSLMPFRDQAERDQHRMVFGGDETYVYPLTAAATLCNEGRKSVKRWN